MSKIVMNTFKQLLGLAAVAIIVCLGTVDVSAQGQAQGGGAGGNGGGRRGRQNMDPAQMRQMRMDRYREQLEVTNDDEWKVIGERVGAVMDAETEVGADRARGGGFGGRGNRNRGANQDTTNNAGGQNQNNNGGGNNGGGRGGRFGGPAPSPELAALQKAIEDKASPDEIKTALAKLRDSHKAKEAKLEKAQDELRKVLSVRQEGQAVLLGLLS